MKDFENTEVDWMDDLWGPVPGKQNHYEGRVTEFGGVEHWNGFDWVIYHNEVISGPDMDMLNPYTFTGFKS